MVRRSRRLGHEEPAVTDRLLAGVRSQSLPLRSAGELDPLLRRVGDARCVLLGEASHGTHEYYAWRAEISKQLIEEQGFSFIAVEGDWPDCYRVNRFVKGYPDSGDEAQEVLHAFRRWPTWMWANEEIADLATWMRHHNEGLPEGKKVGFYGLDVYSLWDSLYGILGFLGKNDPSALPAARRAFQCFEPYGEDAQDYARATRWVDTSCEDEVVTLMGELRGATRKYPGDGEAGFDAEQNALVVKNAERYYRTMVRGGPESWNVRDGHMMETLDRLMQYHGPGARGIVWEHNTHVGDARFTDMAGDGMVNVGQLARERFGEEGVFLVGFGSYRGGVIAGREWDEPMRRMKVPPGRPGSWEDVLHRAGEADRLMLLEAARGSEAFMEERGHRAIGVVYRPEFEAYGNYVPTVLPRRYDAFLYLDRTEALRPLRIPQVEENEVPETYPSGV